MPALKIEYLALAEIVKWPKNPKLHSPAIAISIGRFGFNDPIAINDHPDARFLLEGHGRVEALERMKAERHQAPGNIQEKNGEWLVPVVRLHLGPGEAEAYALAHNRLTEVGSPDGGAWNESMLAEVLDNLQLAEVDLDGIGWSPEELEELLKTDDDSGKAPVADVEPQMDKAEELRQKWGVEPGQVWGLGAFAKCPKCGKVHNL